jgi:hypothetical protein
MQPSFLETSISVRPSICELPKHAGCLGVRSRLALHGAVFVGLDSKRTPGL